VPELVPGAEIAGCRIETVAGRGGMGIVYRATQLSLGRPVALKLITPDRAADTGFRRRFARESRLAAAIDHPNVVPVYAAGEEHGHLYLVMRWVDGTDLHHLLARERRLRPERAGSIVAQVAAALDAAHARELVHRDIKPANVLLAGEHVYLADFGLSMLVRGDPVDTATGQWIGTADFMAPELFQNGEVDARADVYALGCVLHHALTGSVPFPRGTVPATMLAHLREAPPRPSDHGAPHHFDRVIARALAKDPEDRFPSAGDLGRAALAAAAGRSATGAERMVARGAAAPRSESQILTAVLPAVRDEEATALLPAVREEDATVALPGVRDEDATVALPRVRDEDATVALPRVRDADATAALPGDAAPTHVLPAPGDGPLWSDGVRTRETDDGDWGWEVTPPPEHEPVAAPAPPPPTPASRTVAAPRPTLPLGDGRPRPTRRRRLRIALVAAAAAVVAALALVAVVGGGDEPADPTARPGAPVADGEVRSLATRFETAFAGEDAKAIRSLLTADAQRVVPGARQSGRSAVVAAYRRQFDGSDTAGYELTGLKVAGGGAGRASARYRATYADGQPDVTGTIVFGIVRERGRPRIALIATTPDR
jgi:hypothetical protein